MNRKKKLTIDEQITDLETKGVTFKYMSKEEAKRFLKYNNYYFKLKHYAKNYPINPKTKCYVGLDFAYLVELSKIDMYLRKIILEMALDIEHILKTRMLYDMAENEKEDGYGIVQKYYTFSNVRNTINVSADSYSISSDLIDKHKEDEDFALWNIVEILPFGKFVELYTMYYQEYEGYNYSSYLGSIKFLRNAAAHNSCIISSLLKPNGKKKFKKTMQLMNALTKVTTITDTARKNKMANPIMHDFVALLFVYNDLLKVSPNRKMRDKEMKKLKEFFCDENGRVLKNKRFFENNLTLVESYKFIANIIVYIDNQNHNPKHVNFFK